MLNTTSTTLPSSFPTSAIRMPSTPAYATANPINYGLQFHTPTTPTYNQNDDHLYTSIFQHMAQPGAVYDPIASPTKSGIVELASPRGRRERVNAIRPGVVAADVVPEIPQSCHGNASWNSTSEEEADTSVEASMETLEVDHFVRSDDVELSVMPGTRGSSQLLRSVSAGRNVATERRGSIHRSRTTGGKVWTNNKLSETTSSHNHTQCSAPASPTRFFGWERGWEAAKGLSAKMGGVTREEDASEASFWDLEGRTGQGRGQGETHGSVKASSTAPSAFSYGVPSQVVVRGSDEGVPGAPRKLKKRPKSASESTTGATIDTTSHHRFSASTFISTATTGTGATKASTLPSPPSSPSSPSRRRYSLSRGLLRHRRIQSVSSGTGTAENRRHSGLNDTSRIALKRSLTNFRRSVGRTLGPGLTLAVASSDSRNKVQEGEDGSRSAMGAPSAYTVSPVSEASTATPTRESSTTPRPVRPAVITIQAPTPPSSISHPFFDPSLQHKTSSSTFRSKEQETVVEIEDDTFELEREMEDEIQEMRSESGSSNNHRALERFNATLNSVMPSSSETLFARYRDDEVSPWGACVLQTRNALSSPPIPKSDWMRGPPRASFFHQGHSPPLPSTSALPDVFQEGSHSQSSPNTPRHGSTLRLSSITMGSVRSAFAGVGARMSSATSRMSVTSAAGVSMRNGQRAGAGEGTDDDGDFMDLRDPFASPPPAFGKVKTHGTVKNSNLFAPSGPKFSEDFLSVNEVQGEEEGMTTQKETVIDGNDRRRMTAWGRLPMPARQISAATSNRSSYTSTSKSSRATGKTSTVNRKQKRESREKRTRKTSALSTLSRTAAGSAGSKGDTEDVDFGLEEALLSQRLLSRLDAIAWES
ncbi:hypothetical protein D9619_011713 [Psilocybe cf. subviscida]|uniref:Uncharacterized protein n=1 Tax=Psilocybe cf. subviscida TaxID=2480587 RepID=A0A8H5F9F6_9AGAR|nr:hypothetical protein D9619_011713 [Psilocybe cf. subviscida]